MQQAEAEQDKQPAAINCHPLQASLPQARQLQGEANAEQERKDRVEFSFQHRSDEEGEPPLGLGAAGKQVFLRDRKGKPS